MRRLRCVVCELFGEVVEAHYSGVSPSGTEHPLCIEHSESPGLNYSGISRLTSQDVQRLTDRQPRQPRRRTR